MKMIDITGYVNILRNDGRGFPEDMMIFFISVPMRNLRILNIIYFAHGTTADTLSLSGILSMNQYLLMLIKSATSAVAVVFRPMTCA